MRSTFNSVSPRSRLCSDTTCALRIGSLRRLRIGSRGATFSSAWSNPSMRTGLRRRVWRCIDYGDNFAARGLWDDAERALAPALDRHKPPWAAKEFMHALVALMRGDEAGYRAIRDRARSRYKESDPPIDAVDVAMIASLRPDPAFDRAALAGLAERGLEMRWADFPKVYLALALLRTGKLEEAARRLEEYDSNNGFGQRGDDAITTLAAVVRALVRHVQKRPEDARTALALARKRSAELGVRHVAGPQEYLDFLFGWAAARVLLAEAGSLIEGKPERPDPWNALLNAWGETVAGRPDRARSALPRIEAADVASPSERAARGWILSALDETDAALADFDACLEADPENFVARLGRGRLRLAAGRSSDAAEDLVRALDQHDKDRADPFALRATIDRLIVSDDLAFRRALELRLDDRQLWVARARRFAWAQRFKDAAEAYGRAVEDARPADFWREYAAVLILIGDREGYRRLCTAAHAPNVLADPDYTRLLVAARIGSIDPDSGIPVDRLIALADQARQKTDHIQWLNHVGGLARLRSPGKENEAARSLIRVNIDGSNWIGLGMNWYALAIANRLLKFDEDARRWADRGDAWLAECEKEARHVDRIPPRFWVSDYLEAKVLQKEFARLSASR